MKNNAQFSAKDEAAKARQLHRHLRTRSMLGLLFTSVLIGIVAVWFLYSSEVQKLQQSRLLDADFHAMTLQSEVASYKSLAAQITSRSRIRQELEKYLRGEIELRQLNQFTQPKLADAMRLSDAMMGIQRLDPSGEMLVEVGYSTPHALWPADYKSAQIQLGFPRKHLGHRLLVISAPIINRDDVLVGIDIVTFNTDRLTRIIQGFTSPDQPNSMVQIASLVRSNIEFYFDPGDTPLRIDNQIMVGEVLEVQSGLEEDFHVLESGRQRIALVHQSIAGTNWVYFHLQDEDEFLRPAYQTALAAGLAVALLALMGAAVTQVMVRPLAKRIAQQNRSMHELLARNERLLGKVRSSEGRLQSILDNATSAIYLKNLDGQYMMVNRRFLAVFNLRGEDVIGCDDHDLFSDSFAEDFSAKDRYVLDHRKAQEFEEKVEQSDGVHEFLNLRFPVIDADGELYAVGGILTDISERLQTRRELQKSQELFRNLVENSNDWIWEVDTDWVYTYASPRVATILGFEPHEVIGKTPFELMSDEHREHAQSLLSSFTEREVGFSGLEMRHRHKNAQEVVLETSGLPIFDEHGHFAGYRGTDRDITLRRNNEQALRLSEQRFELAMRASNDGLWDWDLLSNNVYLSPRWKSMLGFADSELDNALATWQSLVDDHGRQQTLDLVDECIQGLRDGFEIEYKMRHKRGHWVDVLTHAIVMRNEHNQALRLVGTHVDISQRKATEAALGEYRDQLESMVADRTATIQQQARIIEQSHDAIITTDLLGLVTSWNRGAETLFGYAGEAMLGQGLEAIKDPDKSIQSCEQLVEQLKQDGELEVESRARRSDGACFEALISMSLLSNQQGKAVGVVLYVVDISERKRMEKILREREADLAQAQAIAHIGSWRLDLLRDEMTWSDETYRIYAKPLGSEVNQGYVWASVHPQDYAAVQQAWNAGLQAQPFDLEHRIFVGDSEKWVHQMAEFRVNDAGEVVSVLGTIQDITEVKRAQKATRQALDEARHLAQVRSEFVSNMSHELRTPLNAVRAIAEKSMQETSLQKLHRSMDLMRRASLRSLKLVDDVLDFSNIEAGSLRMTPRPSKLAVSLRNVIKRAQPGAQEKGLKLSLEQAEDLPQWVVLDPLRLEQILANLISNAIKFTASGQIILRAEVERAQLSISVTDTGIGMNIEQQAKLFQPFTQVVSESEPRVDGAGLGLSISRNLAQLMGGELMALSEPDRGSRFVLRLPLRESQPLLALKAQQGGKR